MLIEWEDSRQPQAAWQHLAGYAAAETCKCASVGWLVYDGDDRKGLAPNVGDIGSEQGLQMSGVIHIPARCITRITRVVEAS